MTPMESQHLINARAPTVWDIITDCGNFPVWDSGIAAVSGEIRNGGVIKVRARHGGRGRNLRLRVKLIPGVVMTWTRTVPLRLATTVRTFVLSPRDDVTLLLVRDEIRGPLRGFVRSPFSSNQQDLDGFVDAVRKRAELFG